MLLHMTSVNHWKKVKFSKGLTPSAVTELNKAMRRMSCVTCKCVCVAKGVCFICDTADALVCCVAESVVTLGLSGRNTMATMGDSVELMCRVRRLNLPMTLSWTLQRDGSSLDLDNVLTMYSDGSISWAGEQHSYQLRVQKNPNGLYHYLLINGVSQREAGRYQCHVVVSLKNVPKKLESNSLAVIVRDPGRA